MTYVSQEVLYAIQAQDPDGMPDEPTQADYEAFERWARLSYGDDAWNRYVGGPWYCPEV